MNVAKRIWDTKVVPSCSLNQNIGNIYTGSLYAGLINLIANCGELMVQYFIKKYFREKK